jgi:hypothetical protein
MFILIYILFSVLKFRLLLGDFLSNAYRESYVRVSFVGNTICDIKQLSVLE